MSIRSRESHTYVLLVRKSLETDLDFGTRPPERGLLDPAQNVSHERNITLWVNTSTLGQFARSD